MNPIHQVVCQTSLASWPSAFRCFSRSDLLSTSGGLDVELHLSPLGQSQVSYESKDVQSLTKWWVLEKDDWGCHVRWMFHIFCSENETLRMFNVLQSAAGFIAIPLFGAIVSRSAECGDGRGFEKNQWRRGWKISGFAKGTLAHQ